MNNNYVKVQVEGKNVNNYLIWLIKQRINIFNLKVIKHNQLELIIEYKSYKILKKYSKTYKITIIKKYGYLKLLDILKNKLYIFIALLIGIVFLYLSSNLIFSIDVIYNDQEIVKMIIKELKKHGIDKYKIKKDYKYLNQVKEDILKENKETLEWLEIVEDGTKYIIKLVERKKEIENEKFEFQSITSTKEAIITNIKAYSGEKIKEINDYVKKDEIIVNGILTKPDGKIIYKKADAVVLGNVWYKVDIEYPYAYSEEKTTGKSKEVYVIKFINKKIPLFSYKKYKEFEVETQKIILENNILPISLSKEKQYEVEVKEEIYTWEEAIFNAIELSKKKLLESNNKILKINNVEILKKQTIGSKIKLHLFISVDEDITKVTEVKKMDEEQPENDLQT